MRYTSGKWVNESNANKLHDVWLLLNILAEPNTNPELGRVGVRVCLQVLEEVLGDVRAAENLLHNNGEPLSAAEALSVMNDIRELSGIE